MGSLPFLFPNSFHFIAFLGFQYCSLPLLLLLQQPSPPPLLLLLSLNWRQKIQRTRANAAVLCCDWRAVTLLFKDCEGTTL